LAITLGAPEQDDIEIIHRAYNKRPGQQANALLHDVRQTSVALRAEYDAQRAERRLAYAREVASRQ
jgi:hypothetical protein